jgi:hypothetical protein
MKMVLRLFTIHDNLINHSLFKGINKMAKQHYQPNPRVRQIFDDLEKYLEFCQDYGYKFDEADLYSNKSYIYRQFTKYLTGKPVRYMWELDAKPN